MALCQERSRWRRLPPSYLFFNCALSHLGEPTRVMKA